MQENKTDKFISINFNNRDCSNININININAKDKVSIDTGGIEKLIHKKREGSKVVSHHFYEDSISQKCIDLTDLFLGDTSDRKTTETEEENKYIAKKRGRPRKKNILNKNDTINNYLQKKRIKKSSKGYKKSKKIESDEFAKLNSNEKRGEEKAQSAL